MWWIYKLVKSVLLFGIDMLTVAVDLWPIILIIAIIVIKSRKKAKAKNAAAEKEMDDFLRESAGNPQAQSRSSKGKAPKQEELYWS